MGKSTRADGVVVPADGRGLVSPAGAVLLRETMRAAVLARAACQPGWPGGGRRGRPVTRGKVIADLAAAVAPGGECLAAITVPVPGYSWATLHRGWNAKHADPAEKTWSWRYEHLSNFTRDAQSALTRLLNPGWRMWDQ